MSSFTSNKIGISVKALSLLGSVALHAVLLAAAALLIGDMGTGPAESSSTLHVSVISVEPADDSPVENPAPKPSDKAPEQLQADLPNPTKTVKQTKPVSKPLAIKSKPTTPIDEHLAETAPAQKQSTKPTSDKKGAELKQKKPMQIANAGSYARQTRDYQSNLLRLIERYKYYPLKAKRSGTEGTSTVIFTVRGNGNITGISLARSSGKKILDQAAIQTIKRIGHAPPLPGGRKSWRFTVPMTYDLK